MHLTQVRRCIPLLLLCSPLAAEEIPLKSIHALNAPYASELNAKDGPQLSRILDAIRKMEAAGPAFVVAGEPLAAVHDILVDGKKPGPLPTKGLTLVFYALPCPHYIVIDGVTVEGNKIAVKYHFVTSATAKMNRTLAFIPLPELAKGEAEVELIQLPLKKGRFATPKPPPEFVICKPFTFAVE